MQTIEVTDEQHAFIQRLRQELSEQVVGKYGHVRERDAVQFLIDAYDGDLEADAEVAVDEGAASDDGESITYDEGVEPVDDAEEDRSEDADGPEEGGEADGSGSDSGEESDDGDGSAAAGTAADDDDKLDRMMNLLETHDDKWEESPSADYRYRVTLPDGSTEDVQTKDDVRALLFKNY